MSEGDVLVAETFILHGADINARNGDGRTPLHVAADAGRVDMMVLLLQHGASIDIEDDVRRSTLYFSSNLH